MPSNLNICWKVSNLRCRQKQQWKIPYQFDQSRSCLVKVLVCWLILRRYNQQTTYQLLWCIACNQVITQVPLIRISLICNTNKCPTYTTMLLYWDCTVSRGIHTRVQAQNQQSSTCLCYCIINWMFSNPYGRYKQSTQYKDLPVKNPIIVQMCHAL